MQEFVFENQNFKLVLNERAEAVSLQNKRNGEELIPAGVCEPFFSATQDRPYNNEIKLAYMNKKTTFESSALRVEGGKLLVKFGLYPFEAQIGVDVKEEYMVFTLEKFIADKKDYPQPMDFPPVTELSLVRLPVDKKHTYGQWMNVCHTGAGSSAAVMATSPHAFIDCEIHGEVRTLTAAARRGIKLVGCSAALIVCGSDKLLDAVASIEEDFDLPRGVKSRKSPLLNASIYWSSRIWPENVDEHIEYAKRGGFRMMLLYFACMCKFEGSFSGSYELCGDYDFNEHYPNGEKDLKLVLEKIKAAGITPGIHFLHSHIGADSRYVTPVADRRLHLTRTFTLSKPLSETDTVIYVDENPIDCPIDTEKCRLLRFNGEVISYESYRAEPPYMFVGCKRGHFNTNITEHPAYTVGGVLDVTEFGGSSIYLDQNSDLQDEVADKISKIYGCGFEFVYFDGSEGTNAPFEYHVPNAQYRVYKKLKNAPVFCEGAAKAHFGWHMLSGGNAFDVFPMEIFKDMIIEHPFKEAALMQNDRTRVNFGWWAYNEDTRVDIYEFGTSKAAAYDCPATVINGYIEDWNNNARTYDILEMMRRWEDVRKNNLLTTEDKEMLKNADAEYTLLKNAKGGYELVKYSQAKLSDESSKVYAFVFERGGKAYAVIWDNAGESKLTVSGLGEVTYTREIETEAVAFEKCGDAVILPVSERRYLCSSCSLDELKSALYNAKIDKPSSGV